MAEFPENKQKRLMSLNQDVLAVSPAQAAPRREPKAAQSGTQKSVPSAVPEAAAGRQPTTLLVALALLACAGLLVAVVAVIFALDAKQQLQQISDKMDAPSAQVSSLSKRVADLEGRLDAAGQDTAKMDDKSQSSLLQVNSKLRKTALDVTRLNGDLDKLRNRIDDIAAGGDVAALVKQQGVRLAALEQQLATLKQQGSGSKASSSGQDWEQQVVQLNIKVEKQASEIKAIYRMLESQ